MHKKIQSLLIAGAMSINIIGSSVQVFANVIGIEKDTKLEKVSSEEDTSGVVHPEEHEWKKTETVESLKNVWEHKIEDDKIILKKYIAGETNPKVEIPRTIDGKKVELEGLNANRFTNVTHIRIAKGNDNDKVKLISTSLRGYGTFYHDNKIRYFREG